MFRSSVAMLCLCLVTPLVAQDKARKPADRIQKRTYDFKEAGKEMEYYLFVPSTYDKEKKYPLIIALHGLHSTPQAIIHYFGLVDLAEKHGYIVAAPMGYNTRGWYGQKTPAKFVNKDDPANVSELSEKDVMNVLALTRKEFNIDENRIYLMGHSMGGGGTMHLGVKYPDIWAGLGPIAPAIFFKPAEMVKIKHIPIILVQGDMDTLVHVKYVRPWAEEMKKLEMQYQYIEVPGGDHITVGWTRLPAMFEFFNKHQKKPAQK